MGVQVELHLHLEGTLEPELLMKLAAKNKVPLGLGGSIPASRDGTVSEV